jgi:hypothetical protein
MKNKVTIIFSLILFSSIIASAQVTEAEKTLRALNADTTQGWKTGGVVGFNFAQTSLTNWAAGGENSLAINGMFSGFANYKKGKSVWDNSIDIGYGLMKQGSDDFKKTDDKIDFLSKYGQEAFKNFYYAALLNFKTQMTTGYNYNADGTTTKISNAFAPAYLTIALGMDYKPNAYFSAFIAPVTAKFTIVKDTDLSNAGAFGIDPGETVKSEMGGYIRAIYSKNDFKAELLKNVSFTTKIDLFSNYIDNPENIDVNWEVLLAFKVNKYLNVNFNTQLIYDDNIMILNDRNGNGIVEAGEGSKSLVQFKELFGVGLSFKF